MINAAPTPAMVNTVVKRRTKIDPMMTAVIGISYLVHGS
jgi:hypothetical protein